MVMAQMPTRNKYGRHPPVQRSTQAFNVSWSYTSIVVNIVYTLCKSVFSLCMGRAGGSSRSRLNYLEPHFLSLPGSVGVGLWGRSGLPILSLPGSVGPALLGPLAFLLLLNAMLLEWIE